MRFTILTVIVATLSGSWAQNDNTPPVWSDCQFTNQNGGVTCSYNGAQSTLSTFSYCVGNNNGNLDKEFTYVIKSYGMFIRY